MNNNSQIKPLYIVQASGDLRRAYRVILSPKISAIDQKYLKYLPRITIHPKNKVKAWRSLRRTFHRYHKTTTNIKIYFSLPFHQFNFLRHLSNVRIFHAMRLEDKFISAALLSIARRMRFLERIQSDSTVVRPEILKRLPKLRIIDLYYLAALNKSALVSLEGLFNSNKALKLNLFIKDAYFELDDQTNPKIFERVQRVEIDYSSKMWFTIFSPFYQSLHEIVAMLQILHKDINPEALAVFQTLEKMKQLELLLSCSSPSQWKRTCESLKFPTSLERLSLNIWIDSPSIDISAKEAKLPVSGLNNLTHFACGVVVLGKLPFIDYALELIKDTLLDLQQVKLKSLDIGVAVDPQPSTESPVMTEIMTSIVEFNRT